MALLRTRRPRIRSGRSLHSLGSPLKVQTFGWARNAQASAQPPVGRSR